MDELEKNNQEPKENSDEKSAIDSLNEKLYSRNVVKESNPIDYGSEKYSGDIKKEWGSDTPEEDLPDKVTGVFMKKKKTFLKIFVFSAIAFFVVSIAIGLFVFLGGRNEVSSENIIITLKSAPTAPAGKVFDFGITIENKNTVSLEKSKLVVTFPDGTRDPKNPQTELLRYNENIGLIASGSFTKKDFDAILYGDKGSLKTISISYEYSVPGSNTPFIKKQEFDVTIDASPVIIEVAMADEYTSGQNITAEVTLSYNSDDTIKDIMLVAEYPFGFEYKNSDPKPTFGQEIWYIGNMSPNEKKKISISGLVIGATSDERTIRFNLGVRDSSNVNEISSLISQTVKTYKIKNPLIGLTLSINNKDSGVYATDMGATLVGFLNVWNNTGETLENVEVGVMIPTGFFDEIKTKVDDGGFFRSNERKIVWNRNGTTALQSIPPGRSVGVGFTLELLSASQIGIKSNPGVELVSYVNGQKTSGGSNSLLQNEIGRSVRIKSRLSLSGQSFYSVGNIINSGPIPPIADQKTTYSIVLSLTNSYNNLSRTVVTAKLPNYVEWENVVYPSGESVSYDPLNREVAWIIGPLSANVGVGSPARSVAFKVSMIPSITQVGSTPTLLQNITAEAVDDFTGEAVSSSWGSIDTRIQNDPIYRNGYDKVGM